MSKTNQRIQAGGAIMNRAKTKTIAKHRNYQICRMTDRFGAWEYVLFLNNTFVNRSWNFMELNNIMYKGEDKNNEKNR